MASEWREVNIGDVLDLVSGGTPSKERSDYWSGNIPWASAKDLKHTFLDDTEDHLSEEGLQSKSKLVAPGTVLILTRGMTLLHDVPISVALRPMAFNQDIKAVRAKAGLAKEYTLYLLLGNKQRLLDMVDLAGHGTGRINTDELRSLLIALPPEAEQQAIARILGTLDKKIELNRRMNETLEGMAQALFKSWFVHFDPVRAKAEGRDSELPAPIAALFPDSFEDSELGEIPTGWGTARMAEHFEVVKGLSYKGAGLSDSGLPMHNLNSIYEGGGYKYAGIKHYIGDYRERHVIVPGDVIVANTEQGHDRRLIGYAAVVPGSFGNTGIFTHHLYRVRPRKGSPFTPRYVCHLLNTEEMHDVVGGYTNGTTVNSLVPDGLQAPVMVCPPAELINAFDGLAAHIASRSELSVNECAVLAELRDALLPKLVSGEIRVHAAKQLAGAVI